MTMFNPDLERAQAVQMKYTDMLMKKKQVVGVSVGPIHQNGGLDDEYGLIVLVDEDTPVDTLDISDYIPTELDGVPVTTQAIGDVKALYVGR